MSMSLRKSEPETHVEQGVPRLEAHVEHIQSDVTEIKIDIRRLDDRMRQGFAELNEKIDRKITWVIGLMVTLALALAAAGASAFLWLADKINALTSLVSGH